MSVTNVVESRVIKAPIETVWDYVKDCDFKFWKIVQSAKVENGSPAEVGSTRKVTFKDGTVTLYKIIERSDIRHFVTYEAIESDPPISVLSAMHTFRLTRVTHDNSTFVEWVSDYSSDGGQAVIEDSRYKKQDGLEDLSKITTKQPL
ncbi:Bet v1-like protein [Basidiobolus meristosporus CBS 931.73]|uniref:Bet v1-like protein n=1 Tax=Basidiobolus meristosporus CBS 931.73 TaxID=1314790 RepID=A0A1Y1Y9B2_9FUNG|nr:Bet v1-like protein [Basidiobolus meristosporus CBS 931.73]|eukprot:ORX94475.1 Bet v1-like protein [Basidiobolus meristosporus CBS 931.73]